MKKSVWLWQLVGFAITSFLGTILHFLYEWSGGAVWVAPVSGVNESTWEHMKLLFWPMLFYAAIQWLIWRDRSDFACVKLRGILLGLSLSPLLFYTYNGIIGKSPDFVNIAIFFIAAAAAYIYEARLFNQSELRCKRPRLAVAALVILAVAFIVFTFRTPELAIFCDPVTGGYGIE